MRRSGGLSIAETGQEAAAPFPAPLFPLAGVRRRSAPTAEERISLDENDHFTGESNKPASLRSDGDRQG